MLFKGKKILVTGGTGFMGSHLVSRLLDEGADVRVLTRKKISLDNVEITRGEITDRIALNRATKNIDILFHLAGHVDVTGAIKNPQLDFNTNAMGSFLILDATRKNDVSKFIFISSARVFGDPLYVPINEKHPLNPKELYGASKLVGEIYCNVYYKTYSLKTVIVRPFSVYGPGRMPKKGSLSGVLTIFVKNAFNGKDLSITGDGSQTKDFTYISDVINGFVLAASNRKSIGESFNIGYGEGVSIRRLAELVREKIGRDVEIRHVAQAKETVSNYADITKAKRMLGYESKVPIEKGLEFYIKWYKKEMEIE